MVKRTTQVTESLQVIPEEEEEEEPEIQTLSNTEQDGPSHAIPCHAIDA